MGTVKHQNKTFLEIDSTNLSKSQLRQIKTLNTLLNHVLSTPDEKEFFNNSAELMRMCAALIQQANYPTRACENKEIPYADQALEYSMDILNEQMNEAKIISYDN